MADTDTARTATPTVYYTDATVRAAIAGRDIADAAADISEAATTLRRLATGLYEGYAEGHDPATLVRAAVHDLRQHVRTVTALIDGLVEPAKTEAA